MTAHIQQLADTLEGTCLSLEEGCDRCDLEFDDLTEDELTELDGLVFCCEGCSWWCAAGEWHENPTGGGDLCDDCTEEEDD